MTCNITVTSDGEGALSGVGATLGASGDTAATASCAPATLADSSVANRTTTCTVTYPIPPAAVAIGSVDLIANAIATNATGTEVTGTPSSNVTVSLGVVSVTAAATAHSTNAPAKLGDDVPITVTITNSGPITIDGVVITPPSRVDFTGTACADPVNTTAATNNTPTSVTCATMYTVVADDVISATKALDFGVAIADSGNLMTAVTTPKTVTIPLTNLTTSFTAADCVPVAPAAGNEWQLVVG